MCYYCTVALDPEGEDATIDHVIPRCRGGMNTLKNSVLCCAACNHAKGDRTLPEWLRTNGMRVRRERRSVLLGCPYGEASKVTPAVDAPRYLTQREMRNLYPEHYSQRTGRKYPRGYPLHPALVQTLAEAPIRTDDELHSQL